MTRLRYSEKARDWRNLTWSSLGALILLAALGAWRGRWPWAVAAAVAAAGWMVAGWAWARPSRFRGWYRAVRWTGHHLGRVTGMILLTGVFACVIWPLGLGLRLAGRRPFHDAPNRLAGSYWRPSRQPGSLEQMF